MSWNYRILAHEDNGEIFLQIHEVHFVNNGEISSYTENAVSIGGESLEEIKWTLTKMLDCINKPILWAGDNFPNEYKP